MNQKTGVIRLKVIRAKHHINDLDLGIGKLFTSGAYSHVKEYDAKTREYVWRASVTREVPIEFALLVGDALQNLRTALDHLAWQLVLSNGRIPTQGTGFPIGETPEKYRSVFTRKVKGMPQQAIERIEALKPYGGGNEDLVGLHLLNNVDKHRLLLVVAAAHIGTSVDIRGLLPYDQVATIILPAPLDKWAFPLKHGTELYRCSDQTDQNPKFTFQVAFGDSEVMNGEPILPPLRQLADSIDSLILNFDDLLG